MNASVWICHGRCKSSEPIVPDKLLRRRKLIEALNLGCAAICGDSDLDYLVSGGCCARFSCGRVRERGRRFAIRIIGFQAEATSGSFNHLDLEKCGNVEIFRCRRGRCGEAAFRSHFARTAEVDAIEKSLSSAQVRNEANPL